MPERPAPEDPRKDPAEKPSPRSARGNAGSPKFERPDPALEGEISDIRELSASVAGGDGDHTRIEADAGLAEAEPEAPAPSKRSKRLERIGPYRIQGVLGAGGMGTVYLAEQVEPVTRSVALKVIRSRYSTEEGRIRFETERQAMARLQHPNVAQIFEAGTTEDGHPYFVMERVDGIEINSYCEENRLTLRQRLELFRSVCAGVHHAHQKGIIHRDLKPSNVLVTEDEGQPVPKIIDFGIAKSIDEDEWSSSQVTGDRMVGTPAYLSPEAARIGHGPLDLDTRADVYSLGILLYEVLIGHRPFESQSGLFELLQKIAEGEPPSLFSLWQDLPTAERHQLAAERQSDPAAVAKRLRGDLDWIVLKAIAKDRQLRYDSAAALADDLGRHLRHEPVEASPPSKLYRLQKFVRRRAAFVLAMVGVVIALVGGFVARTLEADRANRAAEAAIAARQETERALQEAERARAEAAEVSAFLTDIFQVSDPSASRGQTVTARELLDDAARKARNGFEDQPAAKARFLQTIADVYRKLGLIEPALDMAEESLKLRRAHLDANHPELAASLSSLAAIYASLGRFEDAAPLLEEALELREKALEPGAASIATTLNDLGNIYTELGREAEAEPLYLRSIEMSRQRTGQMEPDHLVALNNLAVYYSDTGRFDDAEPLLRLFVERVEEIHGPDHLYVAFGLENLADVRGKQGEVLEALEIFAKAEKMLVDILGAEHPEVAYCLRIRADLLRTSGRYDEAEQDYVRALELQRAALPAEHPEIAETLAGLEALPGS